MRCRNANLCKNFILSASVTVTDGTLVVNIPGINCLNGCLAIAQVIPAAATINMPVVITIGTSTTRYPLVDGCGAQLNAGRLDTRRRYRFAFINAPVTPIFKICSGTRCAYNTVPGVIV